MINQKLKLITCLAVATFMSIAVLRLTVVAQEEDEAPPPKAAAAAPTASGPVDITADEQEFATDKVIAKGKVRVVYKDSVIVAPLATLFKDESGNPNSAVFTGHPRLSQAHSKIDAETLTMELQKQGILAVGHAHSEVDIPEDEKDNGLTAQKKTDSKFPAPPVTDPVAKAPKADSDDDDDNKSAAAPTPAAAKSDAPQKDKPPEKIITDSDRQEFDQGTGKFDCTGNVKVINGDMIVHSDRMQVIYGAVTNKPETCLFSGHVIAAQGKNTTYADNINYSLSTKRLQASGNVKSKVIQEKKEDTKKGEPTASLIAAPAGAATTKPLKASANATAIVAPMGDSDKPFWVFSDAQDYNRDGGRMAAQGNVKVVNGDMYGCGPSVVLTKKTDGRADKVYFIGRSQITQPGRRWIADEITYLCETKMVVANGNARATVIQGPDSQKPKRKVIDEQTPTPATPQNQQYAGKKPDVVSQAPTTDKRRISASKIEAPK